ncbi:MAG: hypothetical protein BJ554DRAFT_5451 [Olpidium bornovanus]|uniref:Asparagine synthetase domain-containing protein n=1 Tax=Olpidium bornovanus TaxID=278681 RepID=A0A8H8DL26_9FUNG|nr:MAG: hypothetical protein BJ554DRAFT_5451 [Olpidium bornovanus]
MSALTSHGPGLHSFSIGLENSPDLEAGRKAAKFIGTAHHEFTFTIQEGLDAVSDVIYHLETYDVTTVRASTPMYLLSRKIKGLGIKMVLSGEGSDEVFGVCLCAVSVNGNGAHRTGYLYFHAAPSAEALHEETVNRVNNLHTADCLRANKSTMAWGLEARVPFLDKDFLEVAMGIDPREKLFGEQHPGAAKMEKSVLRRAFDVREGGGACGEAPYLPDSILWRQKEQFSDGVGYGWIDALRATAEARVTDAAWEQRARRWPADTPQTKEAYMYREMFDQHFPQPACAESVVRWIPRADWGECAFPTLNIRRFPLSVGSIWTRAESSCCCLLIGKGGFMNACVREDGKIWYNVNYIRNG